MGFPCASGVGDVVAVDVAGRIGVRVGVADDRDAVVGARRAGRVGCSYEDTIPWLQDNFLLIRNTVAPSKQDR